MLFVILSGSIQDARKKALYSFDQKARVKITLHDNPEILVKYKDIIERETIIKMVESLSKIDAQVSSGSIEIVVGE